MTATQTTPSAGPDTPPGTAPADTRTVRPPSVQGVTAALIMLAFCGGGIWSMVELEIGIARILEGIDNAGHFLARTMPLDFPPLGELVEMTAITLAIVLLATLLSVILSIVAALLAARPTSKSAPVRLVSRAFIVLMRAMPELVLAIFFIRVFGLGSIGGILAMGLHSIGMVGRMYADAIDDADDGPRQALETAGGTRLQQIFGAVLPGVLPAMVATGLHRFDINLRASVILGWVGVGGIGMELAHSLQVMNYPRGVALGFVVLGLCIVVELISGSLRVRLLGHKAQRRTPWFRPTRKLAGQAGVENSLGDAISPPWTPERVGRMFGLAFTVALIALSTWHADIDWAGLVERWPLFGERAAGFFPPDDAGMLTSRLLPDLLLTVQGALAATFLGLFLALPVGFLAARNVAPNRAVAQALRTFIVVVRGIPELILAIIFIVISGMGAMPGVLALALGSTGLLSKLVADSIEETDVRVQDAVAAGGATRRQVFVAATLRQAAPAIVSHVLYQLDVNFRAATLLGIVGFGGIGWWLLNAIRVLQFEVVTTILLMIIGVILFLEFVSVLLRRLVR